MSKKALKTSIKTEIQDIAIYYIYKYFLEKRYRDIEMTRNVSYHNILLTYQFTNGDFIKKYKFNFDSKNTRFCIGNANINLVDRRSGMTLSMEFQIYQKRDYYNKHQDKIGEYFTNKDILSIINNSIRIIKSYNIAPYSLSDDVFKDINSWHNELKIKLDDEVKLKKEQEIINSIEGISQIKRDKKICLLLSMLIKDLYKEQYLDYFDMEKDVYKTCLELLKNTILPCLGYEISNEELGSIILKCQRKLALKKRGGNTHE